MNGFNAFKYVENLREAGVPDKQAEAHLRVLHDIVESNLATKRDIKELEQKMELEINEVKRDIKEFEQKMELEINEIKRDIQELKNELKRDIKELEQKIEFNIKELEQRMTIKLGALIVVTIGILVALSNLQII